MHKPVLKYILILKRRPCGFELFVNTIIAIGNLQITMQDKGTHTSYFSIFCYPTTQSVSSSSDLLIVTIICAQWLICFVIKPWFGLQRATKKKWMNLSKIGNNLSKWVLDLPEPCIHKHTLTHTHAHSHSLLHNNQRYCSSFLKGKGQVQHTKWQFCCQIRKQAEQQQNEIHTLTSVLSQATGWGRDSASRGVRSQASLVWPALHRGGGGNAW